MIPGLTTEEEILELESQIRLLNAKVAAAVDRAADLEDAIRVYKQRERAQSASVAAGQQGAESPIEQTSTLRRMSTFMFSSKRSSAVLNDGSAPVTPTSPRKPAVDESLPLAVQLTKERQLRAQAEQNYTRLQQESEELSQTLFEEANKMVAQERKQNHQITEKLKMLADREEERTARLRHLESAMERILRVRGVLAAAPMVPGQGGPSREPRTPIRSPAAMIAAVSDHRRQEAQSPISTFPSKAQISPAKAIASGNTNTQQSSSNDKAKLNAYERARAEPPRLKTSSSSVTGTQMVLPRLKTNTSMQQAREAAQASAAHLTQEQQQHEREAAIDVEREARQARVAAAASRIHKARLQPRPARTYGNGSSPQQRLASNGVMRRPVPDLVARGKEDARTDDISI